jgi:release factor glutamine methyltransferase
MTSASDRSSAAQLKVLVQHATERLCAAGIDHPRLDAELLMAFAAGATRERLLADTIVVNDALRKRYAALIDLRAARMPLAYIVGRREFYSLELEVSPEVLIPRPETETVVTAALALIAERSTTHVPTSTMPMSQVPIPQVHMLQVLDLGTGSGAIALAIAANAPHVHIVATDVSADALVIAVRNAARLGFATRVEFRRADCWTIGDGGEPLGRFDLIVANPPYIRESEIAWLPPEIRDFEPRAALAAGSDGLDFYRRIAGDARSHLAPGGALIVEVGQGQATEVARIFHAVGLGEIAVINDLAGIQRVVQARWQAPTP